MRLGEKQELFSQLLPRLLDEAHRLGYQVRLKELYRPEEMAEIYAKRGVGIKDSVHCIGLAIDFILFRDGQPLWDSIDYTEVGEFWEGVHPLCRWGGRFLDYKGDPAPDGCHFSLEHGGVK
jgi:hypothetical protein